MTGSFRAALGLFGTALAAALVPASARAGAEAVPAVRVAVVPEAMQLGADEKAQVTVQAPRASAVELACSVGTLEPPREVAPGRFLATYHPPKERLPQFVIITAVAATPGGAAHAWAILRLIGRGMATVKTRPHASVQLKIGDQSFGPVTADATGTARIRVSAPPGVREALFGRQRIDLRLPPVTLINLIADRSFVACDRAQTVTLRLYALESDGTPRAALPARLGATSGTLTPLRRLEPGVFEARWTVSPGAPDSVEQVVARFEDRRDLVLRAGLERVVGPCSRFAARVAPSEARAGETREVVLDVEATDLSGNPTSCPLRLATSSGAAPPLEPLATGRYQAAVPVAPAFGGRSRLDLLVFAGGGDQPVAAASVRLLPAQASRLEVEPAHRKLYADGRTPVVYRIQVTDRFGNGVSEPGRPEITERGDPLEPLVAEGPGLYRTRFLPPRSEAQRRTALAVRFGGLSARTEVELLPARGRFSLATQVGARTNFNDVSGAAAAAQATATLGPLAASLGFEYLNHHRSGGAALPGVSASNDLLTLSAALEARVSRGPRWLGWLRAGPALALVRARAEVPGNPELVESTLAPAALAALGAGWRWGPGLPFVELHLGWYADPKLDILRGALVAAGAGAGYRYEIW